MLLHNKQTGVLVKILNLEALVNPAETAISGRVQSGEEQQDPALIPKEDLIFPSGEVLPRCWLDSSYRTNA